MYSTPIEIHEFSTGIQVQEIEDNWVSTGFTGQYMNATIDPIPDVIIRSIKNNEFKVAEDASSNNPAIIGRVVKNDQFAWSVVAIVTRGRDNFGRSPSLYRYFLCKGDDGLPEILAWIKYQEEQQNQRLVFNPFETKEVGKPYKIKPPTNPPSDLNDDMKTWLSNQVTPVIIQPGQYTPKILNILATEKAKTNNQPISWAFNVKALEEMRRFQIIQAANNEAYELFKRLKENSPKALPPVIADEQALKSAIRVLMNSPSTAKAEHLSTIAKDLANQKVTQNDWNNFFDAEGATKAINLNLYDSRYVNLLTLRAIVIPDTLPEYLNWLENGKNHQTYEIADNFQSAIGKIFRQKPELKQSFQEKFTQGLQVILFSLLDEEISVKSEEISVKSIERFFTSRNSLWEKYSQQFIKNVDYDLRLLSEDYKNPNWRESPFKLTYNFWEKIISDLQYCLSYNKNKLIDKKYQDFGLFFEVLNAREIALLFYRLGYGKVPKKIFKNLTSNEWNDEIYGIQVERDTTALESSILLLEKIINWKLQFPFVLLLIILSFILGSSGRSWISGFSNNQVQQITSPQVTPNTPDVMTGDEAGLPNPQINEQQMEFALSQFEETSQVIQILVNDLKTDFNIQDETQIIVQLRNILGNNNNNLQYNAAIKKEEKDRVKFESYQRQWVQAIYEYQYKDNPRNAVGYLLLPNDSQGRTYQRLKNDISQQLSNKPTEAGREAESENKSDSKKDGCWWIWFDDWFC